MNVGILTPHYAFNYGALLQAFALKKTLEKLRYFPIIINRRPAHQVAIPSITGKLARKLEEHTRGRHFIAFEKKYLQPQTPLFSNKSSMQTYFGDNPLDAICVGSDQVWRDDYRFHERFLDFQQDCIKFSYAASFGKPSFSASEAELEDIQNKLSLFSGISVRESSGVHICAEKFKVSATHVLDPTLLLSSEEYGQFLNIPSISDNKYLFSYLLDSTPRMKQIVHNLSVFLNLSMKSIEEPDVSGQKTAILNRFLLRASVEDWIQGIRNADFVVTNSFHGLAFSIIFKKSFLVFMNQERGTERFLSLLTLFGFEDRLITWDSPNALALISTPVDYTQTESILHKWKNISLDFIIQTLTNFKL